MKSIILATSNQGKINELAAILHPVECIPQSRFNVADAEETGLSFVENALIKARHASACTHLPALADDSGLVVPALNGEPGIYSARYATRNQAKQDNIDYLLWRMRDLHGAERQAYFYCCIALLNHAEDPTPVIATGIFHGVISVEPQGGGGFGYDPIFYVPEHQCTAAELPATIKNQISHRAKALAELRRLL